MENIILSPIDTDILIHRIAERTVELLKRVKNQPEPPKPDELLTRSEALELLKISSATLWQWEQKNKIQSYGIGGKKYFKRSEILNSLTAKK